MHLNQQPGVTISNELMSLSREEIPTALPVFIGFTETSREDEWSEPYEQIVLHAIDSFAHFRQKLGGPPPPTGNASASVLYYTVKHYFDNGGDPCYVVPAATYEVINDIESRIPELLAEKLLAAAAIVKQEPAITLLAVPDMIMLDDDDGDAIAMTNMWTEVVKLVGEGKLFALLDPPVSPSQARQCADAMQLLAPPASVARCAAYWPHLISDYRSIANDASSPFVRVPPSGAVAAAIQRTDRERGVWKAPANIALLRVVKPQYGPNHRDVDDLFYPEGVSINLIRSFPGRGVRIWGCRTLAADTLWRHIQVRRLVSYVESNLSDIARTAVFEPNNAITWFKLKGFATVWLRQLWQGGGLHGTKEEQAFQVLVGLDESMTQTDILQGKLLMKIFLAVLQPAEFIELRLQFDIGDMQTSRISSPQRSVVA